MHLRLVELQRLAAGSEGRLVLLLEVLVMHGHLLPRLLPVVGVPVRVGTVLAAIDLLRGRGARLLRQPYAHFLVVPPVTVEPTHHIGLSTRVSQSEVAGHTVLALRSLGARLAEKSRT